MKITLWFILLFRLCFAFEFLADKQEAFSLAKEEKKPVLLFYGTEFSPEQLHQWTHVKEFASLLELCLVTTEEQEDHAFLCIYSHDQREIVRLSEYELTQASLLQDAMDMIVKDRNLTVVMETLGSRKANPLELEEYYKQAIDLKRSEDARVLLNLGLKSENPFFFLLEKYRLLLEESTLSKPDIDKVKAAILELDPHNERLSHLSMAILEFQLTSIKEKGTEAKIAPLQEYLNTHSVDKDIIWRLEMIMAQCLVESDEFEQALEHAKHALEYAPEVRHNEIAQSIESIETYLRAL